MLLVAGIQKTSMSTIFSETISGTEQSDTLFGGRSVVDLLDAADTINGGAGNDLIYGNGGSDVIFGGAGRDTIYGGAGGDTIYGGASADDSADGADNLIGSEGNDVIYGNGGDDTLFGGTGIVNPTDSNDTIFAGQGNDVIYGNGGNDVIFGGEGNDTIYGGVGDNTVSGGAGSDVFKITSPGSSVFIADFDASNPDEKIDFSALGITSASQLSFTEQGGYVIIAAATGQAVLQGTNVSVSTVQDSSHFVLASPVSGLPAGGGGSGGGGSGAVNTAPLFISGGDNAAVAGRSYTYTIGATDSEGNALSFRAGSAPAWLGTFVDNGNGTATLTGTPTAGDVGISTVTVDVSDGSVTTQQTYTLTVRAAQPVAVTANTTNLDGDTGFRLDGVAAADFSGRSVNTVGDVNGDGLSDIIIGAYGTDYNGMNSGSTYVVFGATSGWADTNALSALNGTTGFRVDGVAADDFSARSVRSAGDMNNDGFDDILISSAEADPNGMLSGSAYVVFGKAAGWAATNNLSALNGTTGFRLDGAAATNLASYSLDYAGDINGDGFGDIVIGAYLADPGAVNNAGVTYVVFGKAGAWAATNNLSALNGTDGFVLNGTTAGANSGRVVSHAGDVNGDGFDDIIIGSQGTSTNGAYSGAAYVVFGQSGAWAASTNLSALNGTTGFRLDGVAANDFLGRCVSSAGDVNGDGFSDLLIDQYNSALTRTESYVVFGKAAGWAAADDIDSFNDGTAGFRIFGVTRTSAQQTSNISSAGDINGDGFDDLLVGDDQGGGGSRGSTYILFGKASGWAGTINVSTLDGTNGFRLNGVDPGDYSGRSVSAGKDINGDGYDDIIVGAWQADPGAVADAGSSYVLFGKNFNGAVTHEGTSGADTLLGTAAADVMVGLQGNDTITGGAGADVLTGGLGADRFVFRAASDSGIGSGNRDIIRDFVQGTDLIDLSAFNGTFSFLGTGAFADGREVRYSISGAQTIIQVDVDGNSVADFQIQINDKITLLSSDFML